MRVFVFKKDFFQMDASRLIMIGLSALLFGGIFWLIGRSNQRKSSRMIEVGMANTDAVRENTVALRELIAKLDRSPGDGEQR